jgi:hypothetical protein
VKGLKRLVAESSQAPMGVHDARRASDSVLLYLGLGHQLLIFDVHQSFTPNFMSLGSCT